METLAGLRPGMASNEYGTPRASRRFPLKIAVALSDSAGVTRDVSASGLFFETEEIFLNSKVLEFELLLPRPSGSMLRLRCQGEVVRVEPGDTSVGIAVRFTHRPFDDGILAQVAEVH